MPTKLYVSVVLILLASSCTCTDQEEPFDISDFVIKVLKPVIEVTRVVDKVVDEIGDRVIELQKIGIDLQFKAIAVERDIQEVIEKAEFFLRMCEDFFYYGNEVNRGNDSKIDHLMELLPQLTRTLVQVNESYINFASKLDETLNTTMSARMDCEYRRTEAKWKTYGTLAVGAATCTAFIIAAPFTCCKSKTANRFVAVPATVIGFGGIVYGTYRTYMGFSQAENTFSLLSATIMSYEANLDEKMGFIKAAHVSVQHTVRLLSDANSTAQESPSFTQTTVTNRVLSAFAEYLGEITKIRKEIVLKSLEVREALKNKKTQDPYWL